MQEEIALHIMCEDNLADYEFWQEASLYMM